MEINEYKDFYKIPIGTKVIIKECHSMPQIVGKAARVAGWMDAETAGYPLMVMLDEPVYIPVAGYGIATQFQGPHICRPDELTVVGALDIPDVFKNMDKPYDQEK
jgi:hypothetical protein